MLAMWADFRLDKFSQIDQGWIRSGPIASPDKQEATRKIPGFLLKNIEVPSKRTIQDPKMSSNWNCLQGDWSDLVYPAEWPNKKKRFTKPGFGSIF